MSKSSTRDLTRSVLGAGWESIPTIEKQRLQSLRECFPQLRLGSRLNTVRSIPAVGKLSQFLFACLFKNVWLWKVWLVRASRSQSLCLVSPALAVPHTDCPLTRGLNYREKNRARPIKSRKGLRLVRPIKPGIPTWGASVLRVLIGQ